MWAKLGKILSKGRFLCYTSVMKNLYIVETEDKWFLFYNDPINGDHFEITEEDAFDLRKIKDGI